MGTTDAQRLIALSLGKIAMSRQQRGGINLHKNLLVASVLHKARTTYMMDNFQTLLANKRAQAEKEAAAKMIIETSVDTNTPASRQCESMIEPVQARGVTGCTTTNNIEVPSGERAVNGNRLVYNNNNAIDDKENAIPVSQNVENKKSCVRDTRDVSPIVTGKVPLGVAEHNNGSSDYVRQLPSCRCAGNNKRRRSFVDSDSVTQPKKPRYEDDSENSDSENEYETKESLDTRGHEIMHTEQSQTQVTNLVDIFNSGFNGLYKDNETSSENTGPGHINVYVSADRSITGHQYVLTDLSCATQVKESVNIPTAIALAV